MELFIKWSRNSSQCQSFWSEIGQFLERPTHKVQLQRRAPPLIYDLDKEDDSSYVQYTSIMMITRLKNCYHETSINIGLYTVKLHVPSSAVLNVNTKNTEIGNVGPLPSSNKVMR